MIKIGKIVLKHGLIMAPMAGVTDRAFRTFAKRFGAEYMVSEMLSAKAVHYGDRKTEELAAIGEEERPVALQIFGNDPAIMAEAADILNRRFHPDAFDINAGCPVHKVVSNGDGSALMRNPSLLRRIVEAVVGILPDVPVTVKIRTGWDETSKNACEAASAAQEGGAAAVCVHGRTRAQMYAPPVDLDAIAAVCRTLTIPVIGNGGIESAEDALIMRERTGCDGLMIARGACGNPWLFRHITDVLEGRSPVYPDAEEKIALAVEHAALLVSYKGEKIGVPEARKHLSWYIKGMPGAPAARDRLNHALTLEEMTSILYGLL